MFIVLMCRTTVSPAKSDGRICGPVNGDSVLDTSLLPRR